MLTADLKKRVGKAFALIRAAGKANGGKLKRKDRGVVIEFLAALRSHDNGRVDRAITKVNETIDY